MPHVESYEQAVEFLFSLVNYERLSGMQYTGDDFKLDHQAYAAMVRSPVAIPRSRSA